MVLIFIKFLIFCFSVRINLILELSSIHYAKSITIMYTLTSGVTYIQPPVIVIEYDELTTSDIGKGTVVDVRNRIE